MQELSPVSRVQVQIEGPAELVGRSLRALPGVERVEARGVVDGVATFVLETGRGRDSRRDVAQLAAQQRWALLELRALGLSLEDLFIRVVAGEEHEEAMGEAAAPAATEEVTS
jgi:ABC-2 type transport system ATP-binding protein